MQVKVLQNALLEHSVILSTFIKLPFVFKTSVLSIFEQLLKIGFTVSVRKYIQFFSQQFCFSGLVCTVLKTQSGQHIHCYNAQGKEIYDDDSAQKLTIWSR